MNAARLSLETGGVENTLDMILFERPIERTVKFYLLIVKEMILNYYFEGVTGEIQRRKSEHERYIDDHLAIISIPFQMPCI